ncbi:hypothetical protein LOC59_03620 [Arthrobacter sp. zg-Y916]|uniref:hypothetical protein n=1 Tax=Arthrobacter sp. zg-Y916 TaxID=2894190 RepID=UPI001E421730|nr:hypothetical protein [Arthrobacter sp. zg-Y916]MCC9192742.1 hypothetical protein [Arthrobacter sp. zg-Y916]
MTHSDEAYEGERESGNERDPQDVEGDPQNLADHDDQRLMGTRLGCAAALKSADHEAVSDEVGFTLDGLGAMCAGHTRSAQAMFTVTLDTLIYRFYPDRNGRKRHYQSQERRGRSRSYR